MGRVVHYGSSDYIGHNGEACFRAVDVVLHRGRPTHPDRSDNFSIHLDGKPAPYAATRASVGMPAKSDGSPWIKLKKSCVETPNRAVYALFCAISVERIGALSIWPKALRFPPSSTIATFSLTPSSLAFSTAASYASGEYRSRERGAEQSPIRAALIFYALWPG